MKISKYNINPTFERNLGQLPNNIKFKLKANGYITFFSEDKITFDLPSSKEKTRHIFFMRFENKNIDAEILCQDKQEGLINYIIGNDKSKWITNIPTYSKLKYEGIYENIDLYYYTNNGDIEYDLVLLKGANPEEISISFEGVDNIEIDKNKDVSLEIGDMKLKLLKPKVYQVIDEKKVNIDCEYKIDEKNNMKFLLEEYDKEYELVLDPIVKLDYSTYIGSASLETGNAIDIDKKGCAYITGMTYDGYISTPGAFQTSKPGDYDSFITKFSADGKSLVYSTYMGGGSEDCGNGIAVDENESAYITGYTYSKNYPVVDGGYKTFKESQYNADVIVTKLNKYGSDLEYSTFVSVTNLYHDYDDGYGSAITLDSLGNVCITGYTNGNYPITGDAYQRVINNYHGIFDGFASKLNKNLSTLLHSTYVGGEGDDYPSSIALDKDGNIYIAGYTTSMYYPATSNAFQYERPGDDNNFKGFVTKLYPNLDYVDYSSYIGGNNIDMVTSIAIDSAGCACITGNTASTNFPITLGSYQIANKGDYDVFISKISKSGSTLLYSTYIGGNSTDYAHAIKVDKYDNIYVVGSTTSSDFPITPDAYQTKYIYERDIFLTIINPNKNRMIYSTYMAGGSSSAYAMELDEYNGVYITGYGDEGFITTPGAYKKTCSGPADAIVAKLVPILIDLTWDSTPSKVNLLDVVTTKLTVINSSSAKVEVNVSYEVSEGILDFIQDSLCVQDIGQNTNEIPSQIYLGNILPNQDSTIGMKLRCITNVYPMNIPIKVTAQVYAYISGQKTFIKTLTERFNIETSAGLSYIPGCNQLCTLEIDGILKTTVSGVPVVYYKSGDSYIYIEPSEGKYVYKVLSSTDNAVEYPVII